MLHAGEIRAYEVVLAPAAIRFFASLQPADQLGLGDALRTELGLGPNADKEIRFDSSIWADGGPGALADIFYTATPLSFGGYTAIHRELTKAEIERLGRQSHASRLIADHGFYVIDVLPAETAFRRWPRLA
jgi:hypothetical protein